MFRRLCFGLFEGLLIGVLLGLLYSRVLGLGAPSALLTALLGSGTGFLVGLIAGRPVWAHQAKIEALLKALVGALAGAGLAFAARRWLGMNVDLQPLGLGAGPAGQLPVAALPLVATALALFFEIDDTSGSAERARDKVRVSSEQAVPNTQRDLADELAELDALDARPPEPPPKERQR